MAATVSSVWAKPGAWALDSEQHEDDLKRDLASTDPAPQPPSADFPTLAAAKSTKTKKKKPQTLSLAEFSTYGSGSGQTIAPSSKEPQRLTVDELLVLPTGPRERTAEELDRTRLGGGFRNYGSYGGGGGDSNYSRSRASERGTGGGYGGNLGGERDTSLSRADEADDWSKSKSAGFGGGASAGGYERRDRNSGGFFNSSRADEADNWASNKSFLPSSDGRRDRRMGFDSFPNGGGADADSWTKRKEESFEGRRFERSGSGFDRERRGGGGGFDVDSEHWRKKEKEEKENGNSSTVGGVRPRLNLQPRTLPVNTSGQPAGTEGKVKGLNPFGEARPREEVLAEKGKDWKEIEEKLESKKGEGGFDGQGFRRRGFGMGRDEEGDHGRRTGRSWRKENYDEGRPPTGEKIEDEVAQLKIEDGVAAQQK